MEEHTEFICRKCNTLVYNPTEQRQLWWKVLLCPRGHRVAPHVSERPIITFAKGFLVTGGTVFWCGWALALVTPHRLFVRLATLLLLVVLLVIVPALLKCVRFRKLSEPAKWLVMTTTYGAAGGLAACVAGFAFLVFWAVARHP